MRELVVFQVNQDVALQEAVVENQIDSNPVERGQRPTVMGRKNYLFSQNDRGAEDNAVFYTLLVNCDILNVPPLQWLTRTLEQINPDMSEDQLIALLPCNFKADAQ